MSVAYDLDLGPDSGFAPGPHRSHRPLALVPAPGAAPDRARRPRRRPDGPAAPMAPAGVRVLRPLPLPDASPTRLTRRGIAVVAVLVAALGAVLVWVAAASARSGDRAGGASAGSPDAVVTVQPGDTLWSIATRAAPDRDPRAEVAALQARNHLTEVDLSPGQVLALP